jgi:hypothetical protein
VRDRQRFEPFGTIKSAVLGAAEGRPAEASLRALVRSEGGMLCPSPPLLTLALTLALVRSEGGMLCPSPPL